MNLINLSAEATGTLYSWLPNKVEPETVVFFPDACPGRSPLPTGTALLSSQENWRQLAISDCGCGMRLLQTGLDRSDLGQREWDDLASLLIANKGKLGDLGGGNHFLDALVSKADEKVYFLIHTGSRKESGLVDDLVDQPAIFDREFCRIVQWAEDNRAEIHKAIERVFGKVKLMLDMPHNTHEKLDDGRVLIRKGSVKVEAGGLCVIPSHMSGDVALVRATEKIEGVLNSMSHGTGRKMSRSECKPLADGFDFEALRKQVMMPSHLNPATLRTEGPYAYRDLDECMMLIDGYVEPVDRFSVIAYMGHL